MSNVKEIRIEAATTSNWWLSYSSGDILETNLPGSQDTSERCRAAASILGWCASPLGGIGMEYKESTCHVGSDRFEFEIGGTEAIASKAVAHIVHCLAILGCEIDSVYEYDMEDPGGGYWTDERIKEAAAGK